MSKARDLLGKLGSGGSPLPKPAPGASHFATPATDEPKDTKNKAPKDIKGGPQPKPQAQGPRTTGTVRPKV